MKKTRISPKKHIGKFISSPPDEFFKPIPKYTTHEIPSSKGVQYQSWVNLPSNTMGKIKHIKGEECPTLELAEESAAKLAIEELEKEKLIIDDVSFFKISKKSKMKFFQNNKIEEKKKSYNIVSPFTEYEDVLSNNQNTFIYRYYIQEQKSKKYINDFGILLTKELDCDLFPPQKIFDESKIRVIRLEKVGIFQPKDNMIDIIIYFNDFFFCKLYNLEKNEEKRIFSFVPLNSDNSIDWEVMKDLKKGKNHELREGTILSLKDSNRKEIFYCMQETEFTPNYKTKKKNLTYKEYFSSFLNKENINWDQKLLEITHVKKGFDIFKNNTKRTRARSGYHKYVIREVCQIEAPKKMNIQYVDRFTKMLPLITSFQNDVQVMQLIKKFKLEKIIKSQSDFSLFKEALSLPRSGIEKNYERLEFLGDCFLKFWTCSLLYFCLPSEYHEQALTSEKNFYVANRILKNLIIDKNVHDYIIHESSKTVSKNYKIPGYSKKKGKENTIISLKQIGDIFESLLGALFILDQKKNGKIDELYDVFNSNSLVFKYLKYLNYGVLKIPIIPHQNTKETIEDLKRGNKIIEDEKMHLIVYKKQKMEEVEAKIQYEFKNKNLLIESLTHPSINDQNFHFPCYQRLKFLGDAILEQIVNEKGFEIIKGGAKELHCYKIVYIANKNLGNFLLNTGIINNVYHSSIELSQWIKNQEVKKRDSSFPRVFGDMIAALFGAVFVDSKSMETTKKVVKIYIDQISEEEKDDIKRKDVTAQKSTQEIPLKKEENPTPILCMFFQKNKIKFSFDYDVSLEEKKCRIIVNGKVFANGIGRNKKIANRNASFEALQIVNSPGFDSTLYSKN